MKRGDFKEIKNEHIDVVKTIIKNHGTCMVISCYDCPFAQRNSANHEDCIPSGYCTDGMSKKDKDEKLLKSAKEFLDMLNTQEYTFKNAKVGDRVWDILKGWGTITSIREDNDYPIRVTSDINTWTIFTLDGKRDEKDINPTLFWNEIKYEMPEKPFSLEEELRKLQVKEFKYNDCNYYLRWDSHHNKLDYGYSIMYNIPCVVYFEKHNIEQFVSKVEHQNITRKEFFRVYNNIFGGSING